MKKRKIKGKEWKKRRKRKSMDKKRAKKKRKIKAKEWKKERKRG